MIYPGASGFPARAVFLCGVGKRWECREIIQALQGRHKTTGGSGRLFNLEHYS